eukprot:GDKJ01001664.1.p1 GENE.GDKJ01001664.1~~GDKJ01001664.1.p1  ORF type:complete len:168 (-),score=50.00 GDKJ01001664.1:57-560(-)
MSSADTPSNLIKVGGAQVDRGLIETFKKLKQGIAEESSESEDETVPEVSDAPGGFNPLSWLSSLGVAVGGQAPAAPILNAKTTSSESDEEMEESKGVDVSIVNSVFENDLPEDVLMRASSEPFWRVKHQDDLQKELEDRREILLEASKSVHKSAKRLQTRKFVGNRK